MLMTTPLLLGTRPPLYFSDHVAGCLVILAAVTAMAEVARVVRFINVALGVWFAASAFVFGGSAAATVTNAVAGVLLIGFSLPRGSRSEAHYGGWDRAIV